MNSDDFYFPGAIASMAKAFEAHPDAGLIYGDTVAVDEKGEFIHFPKYAQWQLEDLLTFNIIGQPAVFMRRDVLLNAGFLDPSFHFLLDHQLWIRMASYAPMVYVSERWAAGRFHESAKNVAQAAKFGEEAFRISDWAESDPSVSGALTRVSRQPTALRRCGLMGDICSMRENPGSQSNPVRRVCHASIHCVRGVEANHLCVSESHWTGRPADGVHVLEENELRQLYPQKDS